MIEKEIVYQIFPKTFKDGLGTGTGNIKGIIQKIEYLSKLGITRIWVSPFYVSPFNDSGYDVTDYKSVDKQFGSLEDFDELIKKANEFNISIIIDIVVNHSSSENSWFQKALKGDEKYMNYYIFKDPVDGKEPTNWKSKFGGSAWQYVESLNKYYLHLFANNQPDLNWRNEAVKNEIKDIFDFWSKRGVKGFRLDVCNLYDKPEKFVDDNIGDGRRFYTDGNNIEKYFEYMNDIAFSKIKDCLTIGEISSTTKEKSANYASKNLNQLSSVFTFLHLKVDYKDNKKWTNMKPDLDQFWKIQKEWQEYYQQSNSVISLFLNNHDQPRALSRFGDDKNHWFASATGWFSFTTLMRGLTVIYQGEEIGMTNYPFKDMNEFFDLETIGNTNDLKKDGYSKEEIFEIAMQKARDHSRTLMQWDDSNNAGFSSSKDVKTLLNPNYKTINVNNQIDDKNSVLEFYKKTIKLKRTLRPLYDGTIEFIKGESYVYKRIFGEEEITIYFNPTKNDRQINTKVNIKNILLNNYEKFEGNILKPFQVLIISNA